MLYTKTADPLYLQLYSKLRDEIRSGKLCQGQMLPSERRLAAEYGISRVTVRMALKYLAVQGYVLIEPQKGARVL